MNCKWHLCWFLLPRHIFEHCTCLAIGEGTRSPNILDFGYLFNRQTSLTGSEYESNYFHPPFNLTIRPSQISACHGRILLSARFSPHSQHSKSSVLRSCPCTSKDSCCIFCNVEWENHVFTHRVMLRVCVKITTSRNQPYPENVRCCFWWDFTHTHILYSL